MKGLLLDALGNGRHIAKFSVTNSVFTVASKLIIMLFYFVAQIKMSTTPETDVNANSVIVLPQESNNFNNVTVHPPPQEQHEHTVDHSLQNIPSDTIATENSFHDPLPG